MNVSHCSKASSKQGPFVWYKGVLYFAWLDIPEEVMKMLNEMKRVDEFKEAVEDLLYCLDVVKIGHSSGDLLKHNDKMHSLMTYLAGAKLQYVAIGVPFGCCESYLLEQGAHFINVAFRVSGEWHRRALGIENAIKDLLERTGGKVIYRGKIESTVKLSTAASGNDGKGSLYSWSLAWSEVQLKVLQKMLNDLTDADAKNYILSQLVHKFGVHLGDKVMTRIRKAFWAHARGRVNYTTYGVYELALQAEKKYHNNFEAKDLWLSGERFYLKNYKSDHGFESLETEIKEQDKVDVESGVAERAWDKRMYSEREAKQWLDCGILTFDEIVNHLMCGVVKMI